MKIEQMIADELQGMFLEGNLNGINEVELNTLTRKLRVGAVTIHELIRDQPLLEEKISVARQRILTTGYHRW
ncbi:hypothetical protein M3182_12625 [Mesobacillus maritimus]|uniref:hypothetical protein n=1 Tax=Mesobacillus maritimus TaxID=1643336 RepID=UPI002040C6E9|nr:hypothetical protein [Mesobacillus maritimus]MCM3586578.1 hypothetical protein [Mesobacillus maritimus]MCM3668668.1 hypothetical protein [Mesobacillus maritimus]